MTQDRNNEKPEIQLWLLNINNFSDSDWAQLEQSLTPEENINAEKKKNKCIYIASRAVSRLALAQHLSVHPQQLVFDKHEKGKPFLPHHPALAFNLSHSGDWIAFALGDVDLLGIDIECHKPRDYVAIAENYFHADELLLLKQLPDDSQEQAALFFHYWTLKEAFFKALGSGIATGLDKVNFSRFNRESSVMFDNSLSLSPSNWFFFCDQTTTEPSLALSVNSPSAIICMNRNLGSLLK